MSHIPDIEEATLDDLPGAHPQHCGRGLGGELLAIATVDIPDDDSWDHLPLAEWTREFWERPTLDRDASIAAVVEGEVVAITMIQVDLDTGRAANTMTGTFPSIAAAGSRGS